MLRFFRVILAVNLFVVYCSALQDNFEIWKTQDFGLYPKLPIAFTWSKNSDCQRDSQLVLDGLKSQTYWAMQMYDSSAQSPHGILQGNVYHMGAYDECMLVQQPIKTHMCSFYITADVAPIPVSNHSPYHLEPPFHDIVWKKFKDSRRDTSKIPRDQIVMALCLPRSCSMQEAVTSINKYLSQHVGNAGQGNRTAYKAIGPYPCAHNDPVIIRPDEFAFWVFCCLIALLAISSTIIDINNNDHEKETKGKRLLMSFSIKRNLIKFISREGEGGPLDFLYGIKFVTICLVIYDHRCAIILGSTVFNYQKIEEELRDYNNLFLPHGDLLVDTFFYIGGLLSCYLMMDILNKRYINPLLVIFGRYIRIAPLYLFIVWFYASGIMRLGSGPVWDIGMGNESLYCRENWWTNALFVNNYVNPQEMCTIQAWYLACDFHYFVICVFLVYLLLKNRRTGLAILVIITVVSAIIPAIVATLHHLKPTVIFYHDFLSQPRRDPTYLYLYVKSHTRATVYFIGILSGYFLYNNRDSIKRYGVGISLVGNILGLLLLFAPMVYGSQYYHPGRTYDPLESGLFAALRRVIWALGCVVLMFTYRFGQVPLIGPLCSSRTMIVLSKLTYGMYLIHFIYQVSDYAKSRLPHFLNLFDLFTMGTSDVVASMFYALILYLVIELPTRSIFKELVFSRENQPPREKDVPLECHDNPITVKISDEVNHNDQNK